MAITQHLARARRNAAQATTPAERFRWLLIVAMLEGAQARQ